MAAEDELALPQVPEAKPDDPEDVSWALSTAEAMWARGDHTEGIKWIRKAAEAASEVERDERALELAKAASELANVVARRSRASMALTAPPAGQEPAAPTTTRSHAPPPPVSLPASPSPSPPPPAYTPPMPPVARSSPPPAMTRSSPPIPLPSMVAQQQPPSQSPPRSMSPSARAPRPLAANPRHRSRENLENEAHAAGVITTVTETAPLPLIDDQTATRALEDTVAVAVPVANARVRRQIRSDPEPTVVARLEDLQQDRQRSALEWDASPTENLTGDEMDHMSNDGERQTAFALPAATVAIAPAPVRAPQSTVHDPGIQTTQAVRVVVWRDANGVHVAPAGTVVSAITIDAVLVVLDEGADLTAWLSQRER